ncbi:MAG: tetratricopeptide repeat protein [Bryobacterales bacterium]|nr:tetratricopeptide repeat protein [Bryobacterales bacterium]
MNRITRRELKQDRFAEEVGRTVTFLEQHRKLLLRYGAAALAVLLIVAGLFYYNRRQAAARQEALRAAMDVMDSPIGPSPAPGIVTYATEADKQAALSKRLTELTSQYAGSREAAIAQFYMGMEALKEGRQDAALKYLTAAAESREQDPASIAKRALADLYEDQGKTAEAEKMLRSLIEKPTILVPKADAAIALARLLAPSKPDEARKLLEPLRSEPGAAGRAAIAAYGELFAGK